MRGLVQEEPMHDNHPSTTLPPKHHTRGALGQGYITAHLLQKPALFVSKKICLRKVAMFECTGESSGKTYFPYLYVYICACVCGWVET